MRRVLLLLVVGLVVAPSAGLAQATVSRPAAVLLPAELASEDAPAARAPSSRSFLGSPTGRTLTGAVIGGWLGYFVSQVAASDWEQDSGIRSSRGAWALTGVVLGAAAGYVVPTGRSGGGTAPPDLRPGIASARGALELEEIRTSGATNAYELIRSHRKEWLIPRGVNSFTESARGRATMEEGLSVVPGADHILVYLNNARLGGTQYLSEISIHMIERIEFVPGPQATFRWGTGHAHGVILLTTSSATAGH
jgi:hypothetical protein